MDGAVLGGELIRLVRVLSAWQQRARDEAQWGWGDPISLGRLIDFGEQRATEISYRHGLDGGGVAELCGAVGASKETLYRRSGPRTVSSVRSSALAAIGAWAG